MSGRKKKRKKIREREKREWEDLREIRRNKT